MASMLGQGNAKYLIIHIETNGQAMARPHLEGHVIYLHNATVSMECRGGSGLLNAE